MSGHCPTRNQPAEWTSRRPSPAQLQPVLGIGTAKMAGIALAVTAGVLAVIVTPRLLSFALVVVAWLAPVTDLHFHYLLVVYVLAVAAYAVWLRRRRHPAELAVDRAVGRLRGRELSPAVAVRQAQSSAPSSQRVSGPSNGMRIAPISCMSSQGRGSIATARAAPSRRRPRPNFRRRDLVRVDQHQSAQPYDGRRRSRTRWPQLLSCDGIRCSIAASCLAGSMICQPAPRS